MSAPESASSSESSDWSGTDPIGELVETIPVDEQWHRVVIDGGVVEVKNYGEFGYYAGWGDSDGANRTS